MSTDRKNKLTENMVFASTEFGIHIVQEVAQQSLMLQPSMSLRDFTKVLDSYIAKAKEAVKPSTIPL